MSCACMNILTMSSLVHPAVPDYMLDALLEGALRHLLEEITDYLPERAGVPPQRLLGPYALSEQLRRIPGTYHLITQEFYVFARFGIYMN